MFDQSNVIVSRNRYVPVLLTLAKLELFPRVVKDRMIVILHNGPLRGTFVQSSVWLGQYQSFSFSPSASIASLQTSTFPSRQQDDWEKPMSLPKQSDIKNHLLRRQRKNLITFDAASHSNYLDYQRLEQNKAFETTLPGEDDDLTPPAVLIEIGRSKA